MRCQTFRVFAGERQECIAARKYREAILGIEKMFRQTDMVTVERLAGVNFHLLVEHMRAFQTQRT